MFDDQFQGESVTAADKQQLAEKLATDVAGWLRESLSQRGAATLVVSGGSTPAPFFKALSELPLEWSKVTVTLADERWVPVDDKLSNEKLIRENLLTNAAAEAEFLSLYNGTDTPEDGWDACQETLQSATLPFDVVILGMGGDGHTASLFPDTDGLQSACDPTTDRLCWPMHPAHLDEARMSLTLAALLNSRQLVLHITGDEKRGVFNRALSDAALPISAVIQAAAARLQVYWAS